jgi:hypothetical protein
MKNEFNDTSFDLAKALHHVAIAKQYFEGIALDNTHGTKKLFNTYAAKMNWVVDDIYLRLKEDSKKFFKDSLINGDTLFASSVAEKMLHLSEETKVTIENLIDAMLAGEEIQIEKI